MRKDVGEGEQASVFYEAYRLQLCDEAHLKQRLKDSEAAVDEKSRKLRLVELQVSDLKHKVAKLKSRAPTDAEPLVEPWKVQDLAKKRKLHEL